MLTTRVTAALLNKYGKKNPADLRAGDTVKVHQRITEGEKQRIQIFEGLVIATKHGKGLDGMVTVRKIASGGIGVERTFPLHSPNVVKIERTKTADVRRAKLYYMRDRKGKNARFKGETNNPMAWSEPTTVELPVEEVIATPAEEIIEEMVAVAEVQEVAVEAGAEASEVNAEELAAESTDPEAATEETKEDVA
jgi:large subunit ribosomal protein L19